VGAIAWGLKTLAMDIGCPVLLLSQLNRAGLRAADDTRPPALIDLKESGDVENHASVVLLLHRPADPVPDTAGAVPIWCRVAKARDGLVRSRQNIKVTSARRCSMMFRHENSICDSGEV